jgi:hypothetical protein
LPLDKLGDHSVAEPVEAQGSLGDLSVASVAALDKLGDLSVASLVASSVAELVEAIEG